MSRIPPQYDYAKCGKKIRQKAFPKVPKLCSRHFLAEDYKVESSDKNKQETDEQNCANEFRSSSSGRKCSSICVAGLTDESYASCE